VGSWLYGVAYHTSLKLRTQIGRRRRREREAAAVRQEGAAAPAVPEVEAILDAELERLPAKYRTPIILCYLEGRTHAEAAVELGWPVGTISGRLARARIMLRSRLIKRGVSLSVAALASLLAAQTASSAPLPLMQTTVEAALAVAAGKTATGIVSVQAAALTEGMVRTMLMTKFQAFTAMVLTIGLIGAGAGVGTYQVFGQTQEEAKSPALTKKLAGVLAGAQDAPDRKPEIGEVLWTLRSPAEVHDVAFAPDGRRVSAAGADGAVRVWDVMSGAEIQNLQWRSEPIRSLAFTPDGKWLAAGDDNGSVGLWEAATGKEIRTLDTRRPVRSVAFSPDGRLLATAGDDRTVRLWDAATGQAVVGIDVGGPLVGAPQAGQVVFAPDGQKLATAGSERGLVVVDLVKEREVYSFAGGQGRLAALGFTPDGKLLATGGIDKIVHVLDAATGKELRRIVGHTDAILSLAISPDGKVLATASADGTVKLWDLATGKEIATLKSSDRKAIWSVRFAPDGTKVATADADKTVKLWSVASKVRAAEAKTAWKDAVVESRQPAPGDRLDQLVQELVKSQKSDDQIIDALFLAAIGRFPAETEKKFAMEHLTKGKDRAEAVTDVLHALTNTREFSAHVQDLTKRTKRPH
jgi:WD40 repeat protein